MLFRSGWHHGLDGHEFEQALGVGDGQGSWCAEVHGVTMSQTQLSIWNELKMVVGRGYQVCHRIGLRLAASLSQPLGNMLEKLTEHVETDL